MTSWEDFCTRFSRMNRGQREEALAAMGHDQRRAFEEAWAEWKEIRARAQAKNKRLAVIAGVPLVALLAVGVWSNRNAAEQRAAEREVDEARAAVREAAEATRRAGQLLDLQPRVDRLADSGLLYRVDPDLNEAFIEPALWRRLTIDARRGVAKTLADYCEAHDGGAWVDLRDKYSGKRLAKYGVWGYKDES